MEVYHTTGFFQLFILSYVPEVVLQDVSLVLVVAPHGLVLANVGAESDSVDARTGIRGLGGRISKLVLTYIKCISTKHRYSE